MALTKKQKRFGLDQKKYWVTRDPHEHKLWIVYLPTIPFQPGERVINRFETYEEAWTFINNRERSKLNGMD